jgi:hypothetical protein
MHAVTPVPDQAQANSDRAARRAPVGSGRPPQLDLDALDVPGLLALQRYAGNQAVGLLVQRCGATPHDGCPCTEEPGEQARAQRIADGSPVVQRFTDGTVDNPSAELPQDSPYAGMDGDLLAMLGRTLVGKTFWRWTGKAKNLGEAMGLLGADDINTLVQLCQRLKGAGLFGSIQTISGLWSTSSLGITFSPEAAISPAALGPNFCKDSSLGQSYHSGKECWREKVEPGTPGLHVCLPGEVHIDPHQDVSSVLPEAPGIQFGGGSLVSFPTLCVYSLIALVGHMQDVVGERPVNVFERYSGDQKKVAGLRDRLGKLELKHEDAAATLDALDARLGPIEAVLRRWAIQGLEGGDGTAEASLTLDQLSAIEREIDGVDSNVTAWETEENPVPMPM